LKASASFPTIQAELTKIDRKNLYLPHLPVSSAITRNPSLSNSTKRRELVNYLAKFVANISKPASTVGLFLPV
jgi:hypothetical protein